jgi:protein tyrosine phosphatase (PTP) superfamily phosphohydrolase (DUF442 family)
MGSLPDEAQIVTSQGLSYVNLPVDFEKPSLADFERFSAAMKAAGGKNVLVHCQANFRAASFVFLYRVIHESAPATQAVPVLTGVWMPNDVWMMNDTLAHYGRSAEII